MFISILIKIRRVLYATHTNGAHKHIYNIRSNLMSAESPLLKDSMNI